MPIIAVVCKRVSMLFGFKYIIIGILQYCSMLLQGVDVSKDAGSLDEQYLKFMADLGALGVCFVQSQWHLIINCSLASCRGS